MLNLNLSASLNITRLIFKPSLCLPHHTVSTFNELPIPLEKGLQKDGRKVEIKAVVLDKDDCFAYPDSVEVYDSYKVIIDRAPHVCLMLSAKLVYRLTSKSSDKHILGANC